MSLSDILQKISADYKERAQKIVDLAMNKAEQIIRDIKEDQHRKNKERWEQALKRKSETLKRAGSKADLQSRQKILLKKRELIQQVIVEAREKLEGLSDQEYIELITPLIEKIGIERGKIIAGQGRMMEIKKAVNALHKDYEVSEGKFQGGFIFQSEHIEINATFDRIFEDLIKQHESEIASALFD